MGEVLPGTGARWTQTTAQRRRRHRSKVAAGSPLRCANYGVVSAFVRSRGYRTDLEEGGDPSEVASVCPPAATTQSVWPRALHSAS